MIRLSFDLMENAVAMNQQQTYQDRIITYIAGITRLFAYIVYEICMAMEV